MNRSTFFLITLCLTALCFLHSCSGQRMYQKGMEAVKLGEYHQSIEKFRKAYRQTKDANQRMHMAFHLGEAYRKLGEYGQAAVWYKSAIKRKHPNPELHLLTAEALSSSGKQQEAKIYYEVYIANHPTNDYARTKLAYGDSIAAWQNKPSRYEVQKMPQLNSRESDYAAFYSSVRGNEIILSSMRKLDRSKKNESQITGQAISQLYRSVFDLQRERWGEPELVDLSGAINTADDNGAAALSPTDDRLLFTRCETSLEHDRGSSIYASHINRGNFSRAEKLNLAPDSLIAAHPFFSASGDTLFFSSNQAGGLGGTDIWMTIRSGETYGKPVNLGAEINSPGNEIFPTTDPQGKLYYSSDAKAGFGGFDIFSASTDSLGEWKTEHLPAPINSTGDDFSLTFLRGSAYPQGLFSSNRKGARKDDIYAFKIPPLEFEIRGAVCNKNNQEPINGAQIRLVATDGTDLRFRAANGQYQLNLKAETEYVIAAYKDNFLSDKIKLNTLGLPHSQTFTGDLFLRPIDQPIALKNIHYEFGSAELTPSSKLALDSLVDILNANPSITIELMAHTDHVGSAQANSFLSQQRAQAVVDFLISKEIKRNRLVAKGYGESSPKQVNEELAQQYPFLKRGNILTENFINRLPAEQQEQCKSINRRTEFRVLSTNYQEELNE